MLIMIVALDFVLPLLVMLHLSLV